jgi:ABC-type lipoprotein release transport system permease subunit
LFGVEALDTVTYGVAVGAVGLAALGASYWPARRAAGVDPMETLRVE